MKIAINSHRLIVWLVTVLTLLPALLADIPEWTMLVFTQANNNLSSFAMKNFSDMASIGSNKNFNALVQWYQPNIKGVWRYKIEAGKMLLDQCLQVDSDGTTSADLIDSMRWAVTNYPANKYSLVLWNHGIGIVDPAWGKMRPWEIHQPRIGFAQEVIRDNPRIQLAGLTVDEAVTEGLDATSTSTCSLMDFVTTSTRGILFNEQTRTYMDNQTLHFALSEIKASVLNNRKLDLLGMDACLMAMLEVGYLAKDVANVLVASQEVELAQGWNYQALVNALNVKNNSAANIARSIVSSYEKMYTNRIPFFTQSAIDLSGMEPIRESLDAMIAAFRACRNTDKSTMMDVLRKARQTCQRFSSPNYVDLHSLLTELQKSMDNVSNATAVTQTTAYTQLRTALAASKTLIETYVFANATGPNMTRAKGLSIYFPFSKIDQSYPKTTFAQDSLWHGFLQEFTTGA